MAWFRKNKNMGIIQQPGKQRLTLAEIAATGGALRIRDISNQLWFPAGQPIPPVAPKGTPPRRYAYTPLTNINWTGREGQVSFQILRNFSNYTIVRAIIESVLDRLCSEHWDFRVIAQDDETKKDYKKRNATDPRIKALKEFFRKPDGWQNFRTWSRGLYDDMLVIDAASIWMQRDQNDRIASLVQIDGAEVFPLLDETGQQPDPNRVLVQTDSKKASHSYLQKKKSADAAGGSPAFQLTPYGFPAQEMTARELVYAVRNRKTFKKYGFSVVEQALAMITLGLARQDFQAAYYTQGNVPEFIAFLPSDTPTSKAEELNGYLDSILTGQLGNRRKGFFMPSYGSEKQPNIVFPKSNEEVLKDTFDEWIARVLCFFFGMSPTAFIKQVNRATAEQMSQESEEQGLQPYLDWMTDTLNEIVQFQFGFNDIEAVTETRKEQDAEKQATVDKIYVSVGIKTLNETREQNGDDPYDIPEADMPMIITATGAQPIGVEHQVAQTQTKIDAGVIPDPNAPPEPPGGNGNGKKPQAGRSGSKKKFTAQKVAIPDSRHDWPTLSPGILSAKSHAARVRAEVALRKCFHKAKDAVIRGASGILARPAKVAKQNDDDEQKQIEDELYGYADPYFSELPLEIGQALEDAGLSGVIQGALQLNIDDATLISSINQQASDWARARAAELVGMSYDEEGNLIPNPDAKWAITETTRQDLRDIVADAFIGNTDREDIVENIKAALETSRVFSDARAAMIAQTEIGRSQMGSSLEVWRKSGLVTKLVWEAVGDNPCPFCLLNDGVEVDFGKPFPSGAHSTLESHPNCACLVRAVGFSV